MGKSSGPRPPDPKETAGAQTAQNIGSAMANNAMQMVNQRTPFGSLDYDQTGNYKWKDPNSGKTYTIPTYTSTVKLSPEQQRIQKQNFGAQENLAATANERSDFLRGYLPNTEALTDQIDSKLYELGSQRLDPRFARQEEDLRTRLSQQGIVPGSEAYNREMELLNQGRNDAYTQLALQGRGQAIQEINNPINQITALLSGSQVASPGVSMQTPQGAATTDVAGITNQAYQQKYNNWQQKNAQTQGLLGGLFGAGATVLGAPSGSILGRLF